MISILISLHVSRINIKKKIHRSGHFVCSCGLFHIRFQEKCRFWIINSLFCCLIIFCWMQTSFLDWIAINSIFAFDILLASTFIKTNVFHKRKLLVRGSLFPLLYLSINGLCKLIVAFHLKWKKITWFDICT